MKAHGRMKILIDTFYVSESIHSSVCFYNLKIKHNQFIICSVSNQSGDNERREKERQQMLKEDHRA